MNTTIGTAAGSVTFSFKDEFVKDKSTNEVMIDACEGIMRALRNIDSMEFITETKKTDPIVEQVIDKFKKRSEVGIAKYNTTLHENNTDDFLNHLQEELMDAVNYIQKLMSNNETTKGHSFINASGDIAMNSKGEVFKLGDKVTFTTCNGAGDATITGFSLDEVHNMIKVHIEKGFAHISFISHV